MNQTVIFCSRAENSAQENMQAFIKVARSHLAIFSASLDFASDIWDVTDFVHRRGRGHNTLRLRFFSLQLTGRYPTTPMSHAFKDFAKAYMRYMQGLRPSKNLMHRLRALRALECALEETEGIADPTLTTPFVLNRATQIIAERLAKTSAYGISQHLEPLAAFMVKNRLTVKSFRWRTFLARPKDSNRVGSEFDRRRHSKLPSEAALNALPIVFRSAVAMSDVIPSSLAALLVSAPDRVSEVLTLRADCEVIEQRPGQGSVYGLRWFPAKGAEPMVKWIIPSMVPVVKEAIARIRSATEEAREIARWYEIHPSKLYLPKHLEHLRDQALLTRSDMMLLFNLTSERAVNQCCKTFGLIPIVERRHWRVRFCDIERVLLTRLPKSFPFLDRELGLRFSEALFVVRRHELHAQRPVNPCVITAVTTDQMNSALGAKVIYGCSSIFSRLGLTEPDGRPIKVSSHQFRHYLNTIAQMGGLSQLDIAKWSGRKHVQQNRAYDHMTTTQLLDRARQAIGNKSDMFGPLATMPEDLPIHREEFSKLRMPTAHVTEIGFCIHDYTMSPCQLHRDCISCDDLVCIKGDDAKTARIQWMLKNTNSLLLKAEEAVNEGYLGSDRWYEHHKKVAERLSQLHVTLTNPAIPSGAIVQLSIPRAEVPKVTSTPLITDLQRNGHEKKV